MVTDPSLSAPKKIASEADSAFPEQTVLVHDNHGRPMVMVEDIETESFAEDVKKWLKSKGLTTELVSHGEDDYRVKADSNQW